jgi:hypothetical protein
MPTAWLVDLRKTALFACVACALSVPIPLWRARASLLHTAASNPRFQLWIVPLLAIGYVGALAPIAFFFAVSQNEAPLRTSRRMRRVSLAAAIAGSIVLADGLIRWIASLRYGLLGLHDLDFRTGGNTISAVAQDRVFIGLVSDLLALLVVASCISVLIALLRRPDDEPQPERPASPRLTTVTKFAMVVGGITLAAFSIQLLATPFTYLTMRDLSLHAGRRPPPFGALFIDVLRNLAVQITLWAAPFVVYQSISKDGTPRAPAAAHPRPIEEEGE